jgi:hypothetical protein
MLKKTLISFCLILSFNLLEAQVYIEKTAVDFTLKIEQDSTYRILRFWKHIDSTIYSSVNYSIADFNTATTERYLKDEINIIEHLWNIAEDSILINVNSFNIGYPLIYRDVYKKHIQAFKNSSDWQNHVNQNGKKLNYKIIKKVMLESDVYKPLNDFLKTKTYYISGFETETHGFVTKENLQKAGFSDSEYIPMPYMVWIILKKTN